MRGATIRIGMLTTSQSRSGTLPSGSTRRQQTRISQSRNVRSRTLIVQVWVRARLRIISLRPYMQQETRWNRCQGMCFSLEGHDDGRAIKVELPVRVTALNGVLTAPVTARGSAISRTG